MLSILFCFLFNERTFFFNQLEKSVSFDLMKASSALESGRIPLWTYLMFNHFSVSLIAVFDITDTLNSRPRFNVFIIFVVPGCHELC